MNATEPRWLDEMLAANARFRERIHPSMLPVERTPGACAVITCMDPRVNLEAIGIPRFTEEGANPSSVRVIRTIGAMAEPRSLVVGIFLAGIREIAVVMHTDCGGCLAFSKIDAILENLKKNLTARQYAEFRQTIGEPFRENLRAWLKAFEDPRKALQQELSALRASSFMPAHVILHGLLYELASGRIEVVVNGYEREA